MSLNAYGDCFLLHLDDQERYSGYVQANGKNYVKVDGKSLKHPLSNLNKLDNIVNISLREKVAGSTAFDTFRLYDIVNGELWFVADVGDNNYYNIFLLHLPADLEPLTSTIAVNSAETKDEQQDTSISGLDTRITTLEGTIVSGLTEEQLGYIADVPTLKTEMDAVEAKNVAQDAEIVITNANVVAVNQRVDATNIVVGQNTTNIATLMGAGSDYNFDARLDAVEALTPNIAINTTAISNIPTATQTLTNKTIDADGTGNNISNLDTSNLKASAGIVYSQLSIADDDIPQAKVSGLITSLNSVSASSTQTLTNKTIDADGTGNNITNLDNDNIKASAGIVYEKLSIADGDLTVEKTSGLGTALADKSTASKTETLTNKTIDADGTGNNISNIDNDNIKAGAGIVYSKLSVNDDDIPQAKVSGLITALNAVSASSTQTLTNKTIDADGTGNNISNLDTSNLKASAGIVYSQLSIADSDIPQGKINGLGSSFALKANADSPTFTGTSQFNGNVNMGASHTLQSRHIVGNDALKLRTIVNGNVEIEPHGTGVVMMTYAKVPLGTGVANASAPAGAVSGTVYKSADNSLHIVP